MIAAFNVWLGVPELALEIITRVVEMLHTSSLLYFAPGKRKLRTESMTLKTDLSLGEVSRLLTRFMVFLKRSTPRIIFISVPCVSLNDLRTRNFSRYTQVQAR